ncbi:MAG TPA: hypothetical protein VMW68_09290 [Methyloceanibacter sp.]|nr:hypothetical protein [Methyloceanibacter sp.]
MGSTRLGWGLAGALLVAVAASGGCTPTEPSRAAQDLCSKDGLMRLVPQLRNADGHFQVPDPTKDLAGFLAAQQGLSNAIEMVLAQTNAAGDPYRAFAGGNAPLTFGARWRAAEIGIQTDGKTISFVNPTFASYGGRSFLDGLRPIDKSNGVFYAIASDGEFPALVYPMPTALPCVNRLVLAADNSVGSWPAPTYALGPAAGGEAFLIANICQDLGKAISVGNQSLLSPNAELFVAFQWADAEDMAAFRTEQKAHRHR